MLPRERLQGLLLVFRALSVYICSCVQGRCISEAGMVHAGLLACKCSILNRLTHTHTYTHAQTACHEACTQSQMRECMGWQARRPDANQPLRVTIMDALSPVAGWAGGAGNRTAPVSLL